MGVSADERQCEVFVSACSDNLLYITNFRRYILVNLVIQEEVVEASTFGIYLIIKIQTSPKLEKFSMLLHLLLSPLPIVMIPKPSDFVVNSYERSWEKVAHWLGCHLTLHPSLVLAMVHCQETDPVLC